MMFDGRTGPDPYVFYKMFHVERAKKAWMLSHDLRLYKALADGPATFEDIAERTGLQRRPLSVLLSANACMGIIDVEDGRYFLYDAQRPLLLEGAKARINPHIPQHGCDAEYDMCRQAFLTNEPVPEAFPPWLNCPEGAPEVTVFAPEPQISVKVLTRFSARSAGRFSGSNRGSSRSSPLIRAIPWMPEPHLPAARPIFPETLYWMPRGRWPQTC